MDYLYNFGDKERENLIKIKAQYVKYCAFYLFKNSIYDKINKIGSD